MAQQGESVASGWTSLRRDVLTAVSAFLIDTLLLCNITFTMGVLVIVVFWLIPKALFAVKRKEVFRIRAFRAAIYIIMVVAGFTAFKANNYIAQHRAVDLIKKVDAFKDKYHRYPNTLDEMVPELMSSVPFSKFTLIFGRFGYSAMQDRTTLMYYGFAPFERRVYDFEFKRWYVID